MMVTLAIIGLFLLLAITFSTGKGAALIAGYNTLSEAEKADYDEAALLKFMGKMMFSLSFSLLLTLIADLLQVKWLNYTGYLLFFIIVIFMIVFMNTNERFKK